MKKLIAISVMCALVAGAAFAETSVGGQVFIGGSFLSGDSVKDSKPAAGAIENDRYNTALKITFSEGSAGGRIRILGNNAGGSDAFDEWFAWWRPIPQLRIQVGSNQDGDFGTAQISGWGFTGENKNNGGNQGAMGEYTGDNWSGGRDHSRTVGWYDGTGGTPNLQFTINAIENLTINIWFPFTSGNASAPGFVLGRFHLNLVYRFIDIGNLYVSFQSNLGYLEAGDDDAWYGTGGVTSAYNSGYWRNTNSPKAFLSFYLTAIENMAVDLGLAYAFPFTNEATKTTYSSPLEVGLGYRVTSGDFNFRLRASLSAGGVTEVDVDGVDPVKDPTRVSVSINPNYKIKNVTVFFYAGLGMQMVEDWEKEKGGIFVSNGSNAVVNWFVNPYVFIPAGNLRFKIGVQVYSDGVTYPYYEKGELKYDAAVIKFNIPFGVYTYF